MVFNIRQTKPGIVRSDFRMTDDVMSNDVMSYDVILKINKNQQTGGPFYEKRMNPEAIKIVRNWSLISVLLNGPSSLTILIPKKILEMIFQNFSDNFDDFFA